MSAWTKLRWRLSSLVQPVADDGAEIPWAFLADAVPDAPMFTDDRHAAVWSRVRAGVLQREGTALPADLEARRG